MRVVEMEEAVLGALLLDETLMDGVADRVDVSDFSVLNHRHIFGVMMDRHERGQSLDQLGIFAELKKLGLQGVNSVTLSDLMIKCPATTAAEHWAEQINESAKLRKMSHEARVLADACANGKVDSVEDCLKALSKVWETGSDHRVRTLSEAAMDYVRFLERTEKGKGSWETGIDLFDEVCNSGIGGGLQQNQLMIVAGRAGAGKTTTALYIIREMMKRNPDLLSCFFSLELTGAALGGKVIRSEVDMQDMQGKDLRGEAFRKAARLGASRLSKGYGKQIRIIDHTGMSPNGILASARRQAKQGVKVFVIDHLHRVAYPNMSDLRHQIGDFCKRLTDFAKDHECLFVVCAQLNRDSEKMMRPPTMADLAESGQIEQHADIILAVHPATQQVSKARVEAIPNLLRFSLLKNRHGAQKSRDFKVSWGHQTFLEMEG